MKTVHKHQLAYFDSTIQEFQIPAEARVVHVQCQRPTPKEHFVTFWTEQPEDGEPVLRTFAVYPTGGHIPDRAEYRGTAIDDFGLVLHLYEIEE